MFQRFSSVSGIAQVTRSKVVLWNPLQPPMLWFQFFIFPNFEHRNDFEHTLTVVKQAYFWETTRHPHFSQVFEMFEADSSLRRPPVGPNEVRCDSVLGAGRGGSGGKFQGVK
jgi:hypothetical protein